jgi:hypothetical protein
MKIRGLGFVGAIVLALSLGFAQSARAQKSSDVSGISDSWSAFANSTSVYDVLDNLGDTVFNGATASGHLRITWENNIPTVYWFGMPLTNSTVTYGENRITVQGLLFGLASQTIRTSFSLDTKGNLVISNSDFLGYDAMKISVNPQNGNTISMAHCRCWGGDGTTVKKKCSDTGCDNSDECHSSGAQANCSWRATQPTQGHTGQK